MTGFRDWARATLGDEAGDRLADDYAQALGRVMDEAVFYGTGAAPRVVIAGHPGGIIDPTTIQENDMKQMPRPTPLVHWVTPEGALPHATQMGVQVQSAEFIAQVTCPVCQIAARAAGEDVPEPAPEPTPEPAPMSACPSPLGTVCGDPTCPVHFGFLTEAERLGVMVGAAYGTALADRDQARNLAVRLEQDLAQALQAMKAAVKDWPDTSWAQDSRAKDDLVQVIETLEAVGSPETPDTSRSAQ